MREKDTSKTTTEDVSYSVQLNDDLDKSPVDSEGTTELVRLDSVYQNSLPSGGYYFLDDPKSRLPSVDTCPMDKMMKKVKEMNLICHKDTNSDLIKYLLTDYLSIVVY